LLCSLKSYTYTYDTLNRITSATDNTGNYNLSNVTYDKNGNILTLNRQGHTNSGATSFGAMDLLDYDYDSGNQLVKVTDTGNSTYGFKDGANQTTEYTYDGNGNMLSDANKGITSISYNHLNLPVQVSFASGNIQYMYDASGSKLRKTVTENGNTTTTDYTGGYIYENGQLQFFGHPEGYVDVDNGNYSYVYNYVDHLGNVRLTYADSDNNGTINPLTEIISEKSYYPFGMTHSGYNNFVSANANSQAEKYQFNGKEIQEELGLDWYNYGARFYDPAIIRFTTIDPKASLFGSQGAYNYAANNPVLFEEKNGEAPQCCGDGSAGIRHDRRNTRLLKGQMTKEQFIEENKAEGMAGLTAVSLISPVDEVTLVGGAIAKYGGPLIKAGIKALSKLFGKSDEVSDAVKAGKVTLEEGAKFANRGEEKIANMLASEGKEVKVLAESTQEGVKSADFMVDGVKTELKSISNLKSKDLSNALKKRILEGKNQSGDIIVDVTGQQGATKELVQEALNRAFGSSDKLNSVRVIGEGFDIIKKTN